MFKWLRILFAFDETSLSKNFNIADPKAQDVKNVTLSLSLPTTDIPTIDLSLYWTASLEKIYEKQFENEEKAHEIFDALSKDLEEAAKLTEENKLDAARNVVDSLFQRYSIYTDQIIQPELEPMTTTNASLLIQAWNKIDSKPVAYVFNVIKKLAGKPLTIQAFKTELDKDSGLCVPEIEVKAFLKTFKKHLLAELSKPINKEAKVVMQNIFFSTPDEAIEYNEKMKELQPEVIPELGEEGLEEMTKVEEEIAPPSLSYEEVEKEKVKEEKTLAKRIENEVDLAVEEKLAEKIRTEFTKADEELVDAMRGVGRTWEEIADYMQKHLKYEKEAVAAFLDQFKRREGEEPAAVQPVPTPEEEMALPEGPKPPEELVSPETHDKLIDELLEEDKKEEEEIPQKEILEIQRQDSEISKKAIEPLETVPDRPVGVEKDTFPPVDFGTVQEPDYGELKPLDTRDMDAIPLDKPMMELKKNDRVYVMSNPETGEDGFEGTFVSKFSQHGDDYAYVETNDHQIKEVKLERVTKAGVKKEVEIEKKAVEVNPLELDFVKLEKDFDEILAREKEEVEIKKAEEHKRKLKIEAAAKEKALKVRTQKELESIKKEVEQIEKEAVPKWLEDVTMKTMDFVTGPMMEMGKDPRILELEKKLKNKEITEEQFNEMKHKLYHPQEVAASQEKEAYSFTWKPTIDQKIVQQVIDQINKMSPETTGAQLTETGYVYIFDEGGSRAESIEGLIQKVEPNWKVGSQEKEAQPPMEQPKVEEVLPETKFKQYKKAPPMGREPTPIPAVPEVEKVYREVQTSQHALQDIENLISQARAKLAAEIKRVEEQGQKIMHEDVLMRNINKLAQLVEATQNKVVDLGDQLVTLIQEERKKPYKVPEKELIAKIEAKFPEVKKFITQVQKGAQSLATTESIRELIFFPKKSHKLSFREVVAESAIDVMKNMYENLVGAFKTLLRLEFPE